ncbi:RWD domain-containing protein 3 isoform X1 [Bufo gargarizans]|uniref:RWD domain-containing protein 3 isoform X1 n=2 Tax=Bufo gargarizans TaxID=30331 RepID=UPI001CF4AFF7|nr:RWD domain-containing protein 3 isoform X1 [Bufo gargarizans]
MSEAALEEISVLSAIYCDPGEWEVLSRSESGITVMIQTNVRRIAESEIRLRLVFDLPVTYPSCLPNLSVSSEELTRAQCKELRDKLLDQAREHLSEPMIHDLVLWTQQNFNSIIGNSIQDEKRLLSAVTDDGTWTTLLHLDHMRAKNKYVKTVEKWTLDLKLTGKLMFMGKLILILLQGDRSNIREYLLLQKTCKVDVDSSGKRCKERMISVLCEMKLPPEHERYPTFEVKEYSSTSELEKEFESAGLSEMFAEYVSGLF